MRRLRVRAVFLGLAAAVGLAAAGCGDAGSDTLPSDRALKDRVIDRGALKGKKG